MKQQGMLVGIVKAQQGYGNLPNLHPHRRELLPLPGSKENRWLFLLKPLTFISVPVVYFFLLPLKFPTPAVAPGATRHWQTCWKAAMQAGEFQLEMMVALFCFSFFPTASTIWQRDVRIRNSGIGEYARIY